MIFDYNSLIGFGGYLEQFGQLNNKPVLLLYKLYTSQPEKISSIVSRFLIKVELFPFKRTSAARGRVQN